MGRRENFKKILNNKKPERLIIDFGGNPLSSMEGMSMHNLLEYLGYDTPRKKDILPFAKVPRIDKRILEHFDIDTRSIGCILKPQDSLYQKISEKEYIDEWGIRRVFTGMYWETVESPLKGATIADLNNYRWPDPESIDIQEVNRYMKKSKRLFEDTDYLICAEHPVFGIFELGCWMCGFDDFLMKMAIDKNFVQRFFEIILEYQKKVIDIYYGNLGNYIHYTSSGDDFAIQENLFISLHQFRNLIKPFLKERIEYAKRYTDAAYLHHSCGSVFSIIEDLIECGVDILNPIQPKAKNMHPGKLKDTFGGRIVFHGGFDTQEILPFETKEVIENSVKELIEIMNIDGGYIFATAHNIQEDVPPENIAYMLDAARQF